MKLIARHGDTEIPVEVDRHGTGYQVQVGEKTFLVDLVDADGSIRSLRLEDGTQFALMHHRTGNQHEVTLAGVKTRVEIVDPLALRRKRSEDTAGERGVITALMPGRIVRILVSAGDVVTKGAGLLILEAMKMENEIQAPLDGTVAAVFVNAGDTVEGGADLLQIE